MTDQTPEQEMASRISSMQHKLSNLQSSVRLSDLRDGVEDLNAKVNELSPRIKNLRVKGYVFGKGFEARAAGLSSQWREIRQNVTQEISRQCPNLEAELSPLESRFSQIHHRSGTPAAIKSSVDRLEKDLEFFESKVRRVESSIRGMYDSFSKQVDVFTRELEQIEWALQQSAEACFQLLPTEGLVMAVKARCSFDEKMGKDDPEGILYLTDQRIIFEQKQEVATKKFLFIATEKEKIQKQLLAEPVGMVDEAVPSKKGLFGHQDHLAVTFKREASVRAVWLHLDGQDCNWWQGLIGQARSGDFDDERVVAIDKKAEEKVRSAPSNCPNCGAPVTQTVLRGMDSIRCEYCQYIIRL